MDFRADTVLARFAAAVLVPFADAVLPFPADARSGAFARSAHPAT